MMIAAGLISLVVMRLIGGPDGQPANENEPLVK
jgi:hypothetical protein